MFFTQGRQPFIEHNSWAVAFGFGNTPGRIGVKFGQRAALYIPSTLNTEHIFWQINIYIKSCLKKTRQLMTPCTARNHYIFYLPKRFFPAGFFKCLYCLGYINFTTWWLWTDDRRRATMWKSKSPQFFNIIMTPCLFFIKMFYLILHSKQNGFKSFPERLA